MSLLSGVLRFRFLFFSPKTLLFLLDLYDSMPFFHLLVNVLENNAIVKYRWFATRFRQDFGV
jgi:hypothetical protein